MPRQIRCALSPRGPGLLLLIVGRIAPQASRSEVLNCQEAHRFIRVPQHFLIQSGVLSCRACHSIRNIRSRWYARNSVSGKKRSGQVSRRPSRRTNSDSIAGSGRYRFSTGLRTSFMSLSNVIRRRSNALSKCAARQSPFLGLRRCSGKSLQGKMWLATSKSSTGFPVMQHLEL